MGSRVITDELVREVVVDLRARYALDDDDVRALGAKLADPERAERSAKNVAFSKEFTSEHSATFDRLGK